MKGSRVTVTSTGGSVEGESRAHDPTLEKPKKKRSRGTGGSEAERLILGWLMHQGWTCHRAAAVGLTKLPTGKFIVKSHDLFGCLDIIGFKRGNEHPQESPETWGVQVTVAKDMAPRRRKIEALPWPDSWRLSIITHEVFPDPSRPSRKAHYVRIYDYKHAYEGPGLWRDPEAIRFDPKETEAFRKKLEAQRKAARK